MVTLEEEEASAPLLSTPSPDSGGPIREDEASESHSAPAGTARREGDLPPAADSERVEVAEGVGKQILKEGRGERRPPRHATCFVHYRAWLASDQSKVEDTWQENQPLELVIGHEKPALRGLALGVGSMRPGERALLTVACQLAYGREGSFSFPHVPPHADLLYEAELIDWEEAREGRARADMTVEERIAAADRRRVDGNDRFKEGDPEAAIQQYEMALGFMGEEFMFQMFGKYRAMANGVRLPCLTNLAACMLRLERYEEAIAHCSTVLAEEENNVKALFRRGKARAALGQSEAAKEDFQKANKLAPRDKAVVVELQKLRDAEKQVLEKQRRLYKGMFKPPKEKKQSWYEVVWGWVCTFLRKIWPFKSIESKQD